jgi:acetoin utilization deacetylase AcuC-like enzyme
VARAAVVDCDVHHGNGTAAIFAGDASVRTLSIHQFNNYPADKPPSTIDIHLADGADDREYLDQLREGCQELLEGFGAELVVYVAGADPYCQDQLGGLNLTLEGLRERDRMVMDMALRGGAGVAVTLAGGYARNPAETVTIHVNTARAAQQVLESAGRRR